MTLKWMPSTVLILLALVGIASACKPQDAPVAPTPITRIYKGTAILTSTTDPFGHLPGGEAHGGFGSRYFQEISATVVDSSPSGVAVFRITTESWLLREPANVRKDDGWSVCDMDFTVEGDIATGATFFGSQFMHECWGARKWTIEGSIDEGVMRGRINMRHEDYGPFVGPTYALDTGWAELVLTRQP